MQNEETLRLFRTKVYVTLIVWPYADHKNFRSADRDHSCPKDPVTRNRTLLSYDALCTNPRIVHRFTKNSRKTDEKISIPKFARPLIEIPSHVRQYLEDQDIDFTDNDDQIFVRAEPEVEIEDEYKPKTIYSSFFEHSKKTTDSQDPKILTVSFIYF